MNKNLSIKIVLYVFCIGLVMPVGFGLSAEGFKQVEKQIDQEADRTAKDASLTLDLIRKDEKTLRSELAKIKAQIKKEQKALNKLKATFKTLSKKELNLEKELAEEHKEVADVEGSVRGALKDAVSMVRDNVITAENPQRSRELDAMMDSKGFPGMKGIRYLVDLYFEELAAGGQIVRYEGEFVGTDGKIVSGEIIRAGRFTAYYRLTDGSMGFLKPEPSGERLVAIAGELPVKSKRALENYYDNQGTILPIDPSGGAVFAHLTKKIDWLEKLEQGGILMYPILGVAGVALLLMLERLLILGTTRAHTDKIMKQLNASALAGKWDECRAICTKKKRVPTCNMLGSALNHIGATQEVLENALQEAILRQMPRLERFLPTLGVLAAIAPLMGLLGTVTGMITIFKVITVVGTGDPSVMSGGISEALLTTQFGLAVAIPIMIIHHFFERRVNKIVGDMEEKGTAFSVILLKTGAVIESDPEIESEAPGV